MTSYYTPTQQPSSSLHDYYYASAPSSSASAARATRRAPRPSPMAVAPPMTYARTYSATRTSTRPQMARAPASAPAAVKYTPSYAPTRTHEPSPYSTPSAACSRSSLRKPRASFDIAQPSSHKHVAFADEGSARPALRSHNTWAPGPATPAAFPVTLPAVAKAAPPADFKMSPLLAHGLLRRAPISYDTQHAPAAAALDRRTRTPVASVLLSEPATAPALPCNAVLALAHPALPWPVLVSPSPSGGPGARHAPLTNLDVLSALHASLHRRAGRTEWDALGAGSPAQRRVRAAFERRCAEAGGDERARGLKRIDWLGGKTRLVGIEVDRRGGGAAGRLVFASPK